MTEYENLKGLALQYSRGSKEGACVAFAVLALCEKIDELKEAIKNGKD